MGNGDGQLLYLEGEKKPYTGEIERKNPRTGKINIVASVKNGELHGMSYSYDETGKLQEEVLFKNRQKVK